MCAHQYGNKEADLLEQEPPGFEPRTSGFKTNQLPLSNHTSVITLQVLIKLYNYHAMMTFDIF